MLDSSTCKKNQSVSDRNIYYVMNDTQKTFKMDILEYAKHVREMFEISKLLPPHTRNNEGYHEAAWDNREITYKK